MKEGDYVIATKWKDGDPQDHWRIGFYDSILPKDCGDRYMVVDGEGKQFRGNGFRRIKKLSNKRGELLFKLIPTIEQSQKSVWWWCRQTIDFLERAVTP